MSSTKLLLIVITLISSSLWAQNAEGSLRAGKASVDITPAYPVQLGGYASRTELSNGTRDRLFARVVAFESNGKRLVLVTCDLWNFRGETIFRFFQEPLLTRFGLKADELFLASTHSHAAPSLAVQEEVDRSLELRERNHPNNLRYTQELREKLMQAVDEAFSSMQPVRYGVGVGASPVGANRRRMTSTGRMVIGRNPDGVVDRDVLVMMLEGSDGSKVATLINFGCHGTSLGSRNLQVSGDILGIASQFVESQLGGEILAPLFVAASGDVNPWFHGVARSEGGDMEEPELLGRVLGTEVVHVSRSIDEFFSTASIRTLASTVSVPGKEQGAPVYEEPGPDESVKIAAARVGNVAFIGFNVEMLTDIGLAIKKASPFRHTFVITHNNGYNHYLPPAHLFKEGGYEIRRSSFAPQAADIVVKEALRMLYELYEP